MFSTEGINDCILAITLLYKLGVITGMRLIITPSKILRQNSVQGRFP